MDPPLRNRVQVQAPVWSTLDIPNEVNAREGRQQQRIAKGVKNGTLTPKQTANLEGREANLQNREQADMAKHNGHLTKTEQRSLNRQENRISHSIARDKAQNR